MDRNLSRVIISIKYALDNEKESFRLFAHLEEEKCVESEVMMMGKAVEQVITFLARRCSDSARSASVLPFTRSR